MIDLATGLDKNRYEVFIAAGGENQLKTEAEALGIKYIPIPHFERRINFISDIFSFLEVFGIIRKVKPGIIHVNSSKAGGVCGLAGFFYKLRDRKLKMIFTAHGWAFHESRPRFQIWTIKILSRLTSLFYSKIICVSEFDKNSAITNRIARPKKIVAIHNGIDLNLNFYDRPEARRKLNIDENDFVIGSIAEWTRNKGLDVLLNATKQLENKNLTILLIGSGENPEENNIKRLASKLKLQNKIIFINFLKDSAKYIKVFDIFVLPSRKEGLPYVLLEAGLAGRPVIATNVGGIPEIVANEVDGLLAKPGDIDALKKTMLKLSGHQEIRNEIAINLKEKIKRRFSLSEMRNETYELYSLSKNERF